MNFLKQHRWMMIGILSITFVGWARVTCFHQSATKHLVFPLVIAWLCTPRRDYRKGTGLVWFAVWWLAEGFLMRRATNAIFDSWENWGVLSLLGAATAVRIARVSWLDAMNPVRKAGVAGEPE